MDEARAVEGRKRLKFEMISAVMGEGGGGGCGAGGGGGGAAGWRQVIGLSGGRRGA